VCVWGGGQQQQQQQGWTEQRQYSKKVQEPDLGGRQSLKFGKVVKLLGVGVASADWQPGQLCVLGGGGGRQQQQQQG
jgi:hypothetical protein